jgi:hypothetical protein
LNRLTPYRNASTRISAYLIVASAVMALLLVAEISGLSAETLRWTSGLVVGATALQLAITGRTGQEAMVFGQTPLQSAGSGGFLTGLVTLGLLLPFLAHGLTHLLMAAIAAGLGGFCGIHAMRSLRQLTLHRPNPALGVLMALAGAVIVLVFFPTTVSEVTLLLGQSAILVAWGILGIALITLTFGGWSGVLSLAQAGATLIVASAIIALAVGVQWIGPPPLPLFIDSGVLDQITALRHSFSLSALPFSETRTQGQSFAGWIGTLVLFFAVALSGGAFTFGATEDKPVAFAAGAACAVALVGCAAAAIGGFALEAAAREFLVQPISQPTTGLLDSSRTGIVSLCGAQPRTEDELLRACNTTAFSKDLLAVEQIKFAPSFLAFGLPHALGLGWIASILANLWKPVLSLICLLVGLLAMVTGIGRHLLGAKYGKPGLASFRIALLRVATLLSLAVTVTVLPLLAQLQPDLVWRILSGALMSMAAAVAASIAFKSSEAAPRSDAAASTPARPQRPGFQGRTPEV